MLDGDYATVSASIWPSHHLTNTMHRYPVDSAIVNQIRHYQLADTIPTGTEHMEIDMIIGNDYWNDFILPGKVPIDGADGLYLLESKFGWILSGRLQGFQDEISNISCMSMLAIDKSSQFQSQSVLFGPQDGTYPKN